MPVAPSAATEGLVAGREREALGVSSTKERAAPGCRSRALTLRSSATEPGTRKHLQASPDGGGSLGARGDLLLSLLQRDGSPSVRPLCVLGRWTGLMVMSQGLKHGRYGSLRDLLGVTRCQPALTLLIWACGAHASTFVLHDDWPCAVPPSLYSRLLVDEGTWTRCCGSLMF